MLHAGVLHGNSNLIANQVSLHGNLTSLSLFLLPSSSQHIYPPASLELLYRLSEFASVLTQVVEVGVGHANRGGGRLAVLDEGGEDVHSATVFRRNLPSSRLAVETHSKCTLPAYETYLQALLVELLAVRALCIANLTLTAKGDLSQGASEAIRLLLTPPVDTMQTVVLYALWLRSEMLRKLVSLSDHSVSTERGRGTDEQGCHIL
jgi:hypothetical protein